MTARLASVLVACALATGCVLGAKTPPLELRYFAPAEAGHAPASAPRRDTALRLGRITAASHLRYRIAHRESAVEIALYETLRWTERPDDYVRRALAHELLDERGLRGVPSGAAPLLTVEITAFEEVRRDGKSFGRVQLQFQLDDETRILASDVITVERAAASTDIVHVVAAIGDAMQAATGELADRVARSLP